MHKIEIPEAVLQRVKSRRGEVHVFEAIEPARTAHIVVDLQNGFMAPGQPVEIATAREIVPNVNRISAALRAAGGLNVFIQYVINPDAKKAWSTWFDHFSSAPFRERLDACFAEGAYGWELWPGLDVAESDLKVPKTRFGAFVPGSSDLDAILRARDIDTLIITGTATNVCCESTARDAMQMNYKVIFVADGNAAASDAEHNATLANMMGRFADVMTTDELVALIGKSAPARQAAE
jgi:ureidoacrylate peracid hydrolase